MKQLPDTVKAFQLPDDHLSAASIMACSIIDQQEATGDLQEQVMMLRGMVAELRDVVRWMVGEVSDLLNRFDVAAQMAAAAQRYPAFKPPQWFFEAESDNLKAMLSRRARYLRGAKVGVDQTWDMLIEFLEATHHPVDKSILAEIVTAVYRKGEC